jgi:hypothetical protein
MYNIIKQAFAKSSTSISTHYEIRQLHSRRKTQHLIKFLPGLLSGAYFSLTKDANLNTLIPYEIPHIFLGIAQVSAFASDFTHQKKSNETAKLASGVMEAYKKYDKEKNLEEMMEVQKINDKFKPYSKLNIRSKNEIVLTTAGITVGEAGLGFAIGFYATEFGKNILKSYIS